MWNATFSKTGYSVAIFSGTAIGAVYHAGTPAPKRWSSSPYDLEEEAYSYRVSDQQWIIEGMRNGAVCGVALNTFWPLLLVVGVPSACIYYGARHLQKTKAEMKKNNKD